VKFLTPKNEIIDIEGEISLEDTKLHETVNLKHGEEYFARQYLQFSLEPEQIPGREHDTVHIFEKEVNSFNYRSPEFSQVDLITLGCSQTFGIGVCYEYIWPNLLAKKLNFTHANISLPGWSASQAIRNFYIYVNTYGKPKAVSLLLPDFFRYLYVVTPEVSRLYSGEEPWPQPRLEVGQLHIDGIWDIKNLPVLSKRPHLMSEVVTPDFSFYQNLDDIYKFLVFCEQLGIAVSISSWHGDETLDLLRALGTINEKLFYEDISESVEKCQNLDHFSIKKELMHDEFDVGLDKAQHMGVHEHMHHAENAEKILRKQLDL